MRKTPRLQLSLGVFLLCDKTWGPKRLKNVIEEKK